MERRSKVESDKRRPFYVAVEICEEGLKDHDKRKDGH